MVVSWGNVRIDGCLPDTWGSQSLGGNGYSPESESMMEEAQILEAGDDIGDSKSKRNDGWVLQQLSVNLPFAGD